MDDGLLQLQLHQQQQQQQRRHQRQHVAADRNGDDDLSPLMDDAAFLTLVSTGGDVNHHGHDHDETTSSRGHAHGGLGTAKTTMMTSAVSLVSSVPLASAAPPSQLLQLQKGRSPSSAQTAQGSLSSAVGSSQLPPLPLVFGLPAVLERALRVSFERGGHELRRAFGCWWTPDTVARLRELRCHRSGDEEHVLLSRLDCEIADVFKFTRPTAIDDECNTSIAQKLIDLGRIHTPKLYMFEASPRTFGVGLPWDHIRITLWIADEDAPGPDHGATTAAAYAGPADEPTEEGEVSSTNRVAQILQSFIDRPDVRAVLAPRGGNGNGGGGGQSKGKPHVRMDNANREIETAVVDRYGNSVLVKIKAVDMEGFPSGARFAGFDACRMMLRNEAERHPIVVARSLTCVLRMILQSMSGGKLRHSNFEDQGLGQGHQQQQQQQGGGNRFMHWSPSCNQDDMGGAYCIFLMVVAFLRIRDLLYADDWKSYKQGNGFSVSNVILSQIDPRHQQHHLIPDIPTAVSSGSILLDLLHFYGKIFDPATMRLDPWTPDRRQVIQHIPKKHPSPPAPSPLSSPQQQNQQWIQIIEPVTLRDLRYPASCTSIFVETFEVMCSAGCLMDLQVGDRGAVARCSVGNKGVGVGRSILGLVIGGETFKHFAKLRASRRSGGAGLSVDVAVGGGVEEEQEEGEVGDSPESDMVFFEAFGVRPRSGGGGGGGSGGTPNTTTTPGSDRARSNGTTATKNVSAAAADKFKAAGAATARNGGNKPGNVAGKGGSGVGAGGGGGAGNKATGGPTPGKKKKMTKAERAAAAAATTTAGRARAAATAGGRAAAPTAGPMGARGGKVAKAQPGHAGHTSMAMTAASGGGVAAAAAVRPSSSPSSATPSSVPGGGYYQQQHTYHHQGGAYPAPLPPMYGGPHISSAEYYGGGGGRGAYVGGGGGGRPPPGYGHHYNSDYWPY